MTVPNMEAPGPMAVGRARDQRDSQHAHSASQAVDVQPRDQRKLQAEEAPPPSLADRTMACIRGGTDAQRLLQILRDGMAPADALHDALAQVGATGDADRLRGFARELQKAIERAVGTP